MVSFIFRYQVTAPYVNGLMTGVITRWQHQLPDACLSSEDTQENNDNSVHKVAALDVLYSLSAEVIPGSDIIHQEKIHYVHVCQISSLHTSG